MDLLKFLHKNTKIIAGNSYMYCSTGVPQGFLTSPILFDIFAENLL